MSSSAIRSKKVFVTSDGEEFSTYGEAQRHEIKTKRLNKLRAVFGGFNLSTATSMLPLDLFNSPRATLAIRDALNDLLTYQRSNNKTAVAVSAVAKAGVVKYQPVG
jgi:hypothetical protein